MAKFKIKFGDGALSTEAQRSNLSNTIVSYNSEIGRMNDEVEVLDRYDDFDALKITLDEYARTSESGEYGIRHNPNIHVDDKVILPRQGTAAARFLRELRGFGLLADVVGSGKTIEACEVLSELATRGNIDTMLLIVPDQVYDSWIKTLEKWFGLGEGMLYRMGDKFDLQKETVACSDGFLRPRHPAMIVLDSDFVKWDESVARRVLFDVIVVDEAHHLCDEEGEMSKALKMLSLMMQVKAKALKTYCLLLSATPHSGNLEQMFRLWYFIRCKGGNPADFDIKEDKKRTAEYNKEKRYYQEHVCRGATTVMEFVKTVKTRVVAGYKHTNPDGTVDEVKSICPAEFAEYLDDRDISKDEFETYSPSEKWSVVDEFLQAREKANRNDEIVADVNRRAASAYHNGVLRSIMIRQPDKNGEGRIVKDKHIVNYLYVPAKPAGDVSVIGLSGEPITVHTDKLDTDKAITCPDGIMSMTEYIVNADPDAARRLSDRREDEAKIMYERVLPKIGVSDDSFYKIGSIAYYNEQASSIPDGVDTHYVFCDPNATEIDRKLPMIAELLEKHKHERVILFFDYDLPKKKRIVDGIQAALEADSRFKSRIIVGTEENRDKTIKSFMSDKGKNSVLIVKEAGFTEGANLQKCNIIINVQVTPDPLAMDQRIGRIFRLGQENDVIIYSLADMRELEGYILMYFARIELMSSSSGDATIIAGSNNARMVTVRCPVCGNVKLLSSDEYETAKQKDKDDLYCSETKQCMTMGEMAGHGHEGMLMEEISVYNFRCESCERKLMRSVDGEGYICMSKSRYNTDGLGGVICNAAERGNREYYCSKICALAHCSRFREGPLKDKCPALKLYLSNPNATDIDLMGECEFCTEELCLAKCKINTGAGAIAACGDCEYATCNPKPHVIKFDEKWEAECPKCGGRIKPATTRTFATYIRSAWDFKHDGGRAFCKNLEKETHNVEVIKKILDIDDEKSDGEED